MKQNYRIYRKKYLLIGMECLVSVDTMLGGGMNLNLVVRSVC